MAEKIKLYGKDTLHYLVQENLACFYEQSFNKFDAGEKYLHSWYIDLLCEYLEAFATGEIKRLNINMPPRFGKSALCNVAFSMWMLGLNPEYKIITVSYTATLAKKLHGYARAIANTSWYQRAFPDFEISSSAVKLDKSDTKNTQSEFITTAGGFRVAASTGGSITGEGGKILIVDDLMSPKETMSNTQRESAHDWTRRTIFTRFNNRKKARILNIQQRLHEDDFTGVYTDSSWENVIIPIQARQDIIYSFGNIEYTYKKDSWLEERRYGAYELAEDKKNMGSDVVETQFFQETIPADGEIFKKEYFKYYRYLPKMDFMNIYADTASKEGRDNDYSVFMCWGCLTKNKRKYAYLIDIWRDKLTTPKLVDAAIDFWNLHKNNDDKVPLRKFAIEDKSSGIGLIQIFEESFNIPVTKLIADKDKVSRAKDIMPRIESGQVLFPHHSVPNTAFMLQFEKELLKFSNKKGNNKKDQVDTFSYAIRDLLYDLGENKKINYSSLLAESSTISF